MNTDKNAANQERTVAVQNGWAMLAAVIGVYLMLAGTFFNLAPRGAMEVPVVLLAVLVFIANCVATGGFFTLQPNQGCVLVLFGAYQGTVRQDGLHWTNPFNRKFKISLRARNFNGEKLKVNDKSGNPIEIAAVVVWRVFRSVTKMAKTSTWRMHIRRQMTNWTVTGPVA